MRRLMGFVVLVVLLAVVSVTLSNAMAPPDEQQIRHDSIQAAGESRH